MAKLGKDVRSQKQKVLFKEQVHFGSKFCLIFSCSQAEFRDAPRAIVKLAVAAGVSGVLAFPLR